MTRPIVDYRQADVGPSAVQRPVFGVGLVALPPLTAMLAWPVLSFTLDLAGMLLSFFVMLLCVRWCRDTSQRVASWQWAVRAEAAERGDAAVVPPNYLRNLRRLLYAAQVVGVLGSWPLFGLTLHVLERFGWHWGWS